MVHGSVDHSVVARGFGGAWGWVGIGTMAACSLAYPWVLLLWRLPSSLLLLLLLLLALARHEFAVRKHRGAWGGFVPVVWGLVGGKSVLAISGGSS